MSGKLQFLSLIRASFGICWEVSEFVGSFTRSRSSLIAENLLRKQRQRRFGERVPCCGVPVHFKTSKETPPRAVRVRLDCIEVGICQVMSAAHKAGKSSASCCGEALRQILLEE